MKTLFYTVILMLTVSAIEAQICNNLWPVVSPDGQYVYFSSDRHGGNFEIYRCDIDGNNLIRLTNSSDPKMYPAVSPDGSKITFQSSDYGTSAEIFIMDNDGINLVRLTDNSTYDGIPSFSPDGQKLIFSAWDGEEYPEIFTMNIDGSQRTQLTNMSGANWQYAPRYHPGGTNIYFEAGYNADNHLMMMDTDGTNWVDITPPNYFGYYDGGIDFNADGSKIIFFTTEWVGYNNGSDIVIANADGSEWQRLTYSTDGDYYYEPAFDRVSNKIFYCYNAVSSENIWTMLSMNDVGFEVTPFNNCFNVGVEELENSSDINIHPNPASGAVMVQVPSVSETSITLTNTLGQDYSPPFTTDREKMLIDLNGLSKGIYALQIHSGSQMRTELIVIE